MSGDLHRMALEVCREVSSQLGPLFDEDDVDALPSLAAEEIREWRDATGGSRPVLVQNPILGEAAHEMWTTARDGDLTAWVDAGERFAAAIVEYALACSVPSSPAVRSATPKPSEVARPLNLSQAGAAGKRASADVREAGEHILGNLVHYQNDRSAKSDDLDYLCGMLLHWYTQGFRAALRSGPGAPTEEENL